MSRNSYAVGQEIELSVEFTNLSKEPTDPSTVTLLKKHQDSAQTTHVYGVDGGVLKTATGRYTYKTTVTASTQKGRWHYRWEGTGGLTAADDGEFDITPTAFTRP